MQDASTEMIMDYQECPFYFKNGELYATRKRRKENIELMNNYMMRKAQWTKKKQLRDEYRKNYKVKI